MRKFFRISAFVAAIVVVQSAMAGPFDYLFGTPTLVKQWRYISPSGEAGAEIVAYDTTTNRVFVTNAANGKVDVLNGTDGSYIGDIFVGAVNSVATHDGLVAIAVHSGTVGVKGKVVFVDAATLAIRSETEAGFLPDMVTFTPNGKYVLVANEGEPNDDYTIDPVGSVSIIKVGNGTNPQTTDVGFAAYNGQEAALRAKGVRIFGPNASAAQDFEPEYIAVSRDSKTAYVTLQENNAVAVVDIKKKKVLSINPLGFKDHSLTKNAMDASDKDDEINIQSWPTRGMYQPDSISAFNFLGFTLLATANEGDSRDYGGFSEEARVKNLTLDPTAFPNATDLQEDENLGRLKTTTANGNTDGDGDFDEIFSYGARSFSIWLFSAWGTTLQIYDSGDDFEQITAAELPDDFNSNNDENDSFDSRSDDKGPEPEALATGHDLSQTFCFIGMERVGGIMLYEITNPVSPQFIEYVNERDFSAEDIQDAQDSGPEGIVFVPRAASPFTEPVILVASELTGTTTLFRIKRVGGLFSFLLND